MTGGYEEKAALFQHGCIFEENLGVGFFRAASLSAQSGLKHGFTARYGGVSEGPFRSLNLGWSRPEAPETLAENLRIFCAAAGLEKNSLVVVAYEHGNNVLAVDRRDCGRGFAREPLPPCDGLVTNDPNIVLTTSHADCGAIFLYDPVKRAIGLAHAGWKGTLGRIGARAAALMQSKYGSDPKDIIASSGPCICRDCYEVELELAECFETEFDTPCHVLGRPGKAQLDLEKAAAIQLMDAGIQPQNITLMHACTFELEDKLFSHRRDKNGTGDMAAYMQLI